MKVVTSLQVYVGNPAKGQMVLVSPVPVSFEVSEGFFLSFLFTSFLN